MNKQEFTELLTNPHKLHSSDISQLEEVVNNFPYCQAAHILLARIAHQSGSMLTEQKVKKAAAYALDRKKLKNFIVDKNNVREPAIISILNTMETVHPKQEVLSAPSPVVEKRQEQEEIKIDIPEPLKEELPQKNIASSQDDFYKELEENLKKLHQLKKDISKFKPGEKQKAAEPEKEEPKTIIPVVKPEEQPKSDPQKIEFKYDKQEEVLNESIIPTRYEDDLVSAPKEQVTDSDLLLNYLSFLEGKRQKRDRKKEEEIIEKFIKEDPSIPHLSPEKLPEQAEDLSEKSTTISKTPVSENFARILLLQGKRDKALEIYEELILKYPEKRAYFASKIEELKK